MPNAAAHRKPARDSPMCPAPRGLCTVPARQKNSPAASAEVSAGHPTEGRRVGLPGQQRPSERLWATTPRRLADKPAPSLHSAHHRKSPAGAGLSQSCGPPKNRRNSAHTETIPQKRLHSTRPQKKPRCAGKRAGLGPMRAAGECKERQPTPGHRSRFSPQGTSKRCGANWGRALTDGRLIALVEVIVHC
jgi:hypothetical protein